MRITILEPALAELNRAALYYESHENDLGKAFLDEYENCIARIARFPAAWPLVSKNCRRSFLRRFPFGVIYHTDADIIVIVAIMHLNRKPDYWHERI